MKTTLFFTTLLLAVRLSADTIHLKGGGSWNGTVTYDGTRFTVESPQGSPTYKPGEVDRIEFNTYTINPPNTVQACTWWKILLCFSECGMDRWNRLWLLYLYGDQFYGRSEVPRTKLVPAKPPKAKRAAYKPSPQGGVFGQLEFTNKNDRPVRCFVLKIGDQDLNIQDSRPYHRNEVRAFSLQPPPTPAK